MALFHCQSVKFGPGSFLLLHDDLSPPSRGILYGEGNVFPVLIAGQGGNEAHGPTIAETT